MHDYDDNETTQKTITPRGDHHNIMSASFLCGVDDGIKNAVTKSGNRIHLVQLHLLTLMHINVHLD